MDPTWTQAAGALLAGAGILLLALRPLSRRAHARELGRRKIVVAEVARWRRERENERNDRNSADDAFTPIIEYVVDGHRYQMPRRGSPQASRGTPGEIVLVAYLPQLPSDAIEVDDPGTAALGCAGVLLATGLVLLGLSLGLGIDPLD